MRRVALLLPLLVCGCGGSSATDAPPAPVPATATAALECDGPTYAEGAGDYDSGLERVQGLPETALVDWLGNEAPEVPRSGYRVEARGGGRALLSFDVDGRTKVAVVTADGMRDDAGGTGWGVESWAQCDPSELPEALAEGVWQDTAGRRVPVSRIRSFPGAEHCGWQDVTFLTVGDRWYVRDTTGGELDPLLRTTFQADAALPAAARDTGLRQDGRALWLTADAAYVVGSAGTERWPRARQPILCS